MSIEHPNRTLHLPSLSIQGFRGITNLSIPRFAPVTLVTGMNNTGKTSVLEAVRLFSEEATPEVIRELLQFREENAEAIATDQDSPRDAPFLVSALFHGFPRLYENPEPIVFSHNDNSRQMQIQVSWFRENYDADGNSRLIRDEPLSFQEPDSVPALVVQTDGKRGIYPVDRIDRMASARRSYYRSDSRQMVSRFVNSAGPERTDVLGPLWDNISSTPREKYVIEALRILDPDISDVSMVVEQSRGLSRTAVVWSDKFNRRVPLRSFGEGMNRLFGIILSLVNVSGGILLVDEFDNGMHYTVQVQAWRLVFNLARELDVQVLATTHSLDCIAGFRQAASEEEEEGLMMRIDRLGSQMRAVEYTEEDLLVAMSQRIEVR
jgi:hypothetical protein